MAGFHIKNAKEILCMMKIDSYKTLFSFSFFEN
jgi:hypothetical protein